MEEEGIAYYVTHAEGAHKLVLTDSNRMTPELSPAVVRYFRERRGAHEEGGIRAWEKTQSIRANKVTLWDTNFELRGAISTADAHQRRPRRRRQHRVRRRAPR